jgi:hypothetical protein
MEDEQSTALATSEETGGTISAFAGGEAFTTAQRMAKALASSSLVPKEYRENIPNVLIAMELANRIGASVMMTMQHLHVIHGRPGWSSTFLIATVNNSGRFSPLRFRWEGEPGTDAWGCRAVARDKDTDDECLGALITMGLAKAEGWSTKSGSKWKTMPEQMLMYRAAAFWTRAYAPELSLGMQTADELDDVSNATQSMGQLPPELVPGDKSALEQALRGDSASGGDDDPADDPADDGEQHPELPLEGAANG